MKRYTLAIILILLQSSVVFSQYNENEQHLHSKRVSRIGILNIQASKRVFNFASLSKFSEGNSVIGVSSFGIKPLKNSDARILPFSVDIFVDKNELGRFYKYDVSAFGATLASTINDRYANEIKLDALNFDREHFRENGSPIIVDRFKLIGVKYTGMMTVLPNIFKITISGKISPIQSTRQSKVSDDIQQTLVDKTTDTDVAFPNNPENASVIKEIIGTGFSLHNDHQTSLEFKRGFSFKAVTGAAEAFLGDSEFSLGVILFNFLESKLSYAIDGIQTSVAAEENFNGHQGFEIDFLSYKTSLTAELKLERLVPAKNFFRHFVIFGELTKEKSYLSVSDLAASEKIGNDYQTDKTFYHNTTATAGLRFTFLKPYKRVHTNPFNP